MTDSERIAVLEVRLAEAETRLDLQADHLATVYRIMAAACEAAGLRHLHAV